MAGIKAIRSSNTFCTIVVTTAVLTDTFLYSLVIPLLPSILVTRTRLPQEHVQTWVSLLLAIYGGLFLIGPVLVGFYIDRCKSKQTPFTLGLLALSAATLLFFWSTNIAALAVARALQGFSAAVVWTSGMTFLDARVGSERIGTAMGVVTAGASCGDLAGPVVGGLLFEYSGESGVAAVALFFLFLDVVLRLLLIDPPMPSVAINEVDRETERLLSRSNRDDVGEDCYNAGVRDFHLDPEHMSTSHGLSGGVQRKRSAYVILLANFDFLASLWAIWISTTIRTALETTIPLFVQRNFNWTVGMSGLVLLALVAPSLLGPLFGRLNDRFGPRWPTSITFVAMALSFLVLGFCQNGTPAIRVLFCTMVFGVGASIFLITVVHMAAVAVVANDMEKKPNAGKTALKGKAFSLMNHAFAAGILVGPLWGGGLHEHAGWLVMCVSLSSACVLSMFLIAFSWRKWIQPGEIDKVQRMPN